MLARTLLAMILFSMVSFAYAELEVLDDKTLDEQKGQAGITIDLEFKMSIGEIAHKYGDGKESGLVGSVPTMPEVAPRIEYVLPKK